MKTAMQELIDRLDKTEKQLDKENNLVMSSALYAAKSMALESLEKEKKSMLHFGLYVKKNGWVGCKIEDLYEDYNNQNK